MTAKVTVDDADPNIYYSGTWFEAGSSNEADSTTHGTRDAGSKAVFNFTGSSISVFGTVPDIGAEQTAPISTYSIDGSDPVAFSPTLGQDILYKQLFFQSSSLSEGQHSLIITSTVSKGFFWLDYFEITPSTSSDTPVPAILASMSTSDVPSPSSSLPPATVTLTSFISRPTPTPTTINDNDSRAKYSGNWFTAGSQNESGGTLHGTRESGAKVTLNFTGTSVSVYGTISGSDLGDAPISTYSIDGSDPVTFTALPGKTVTFKRLYFYSAILKDGDHTLVATSTVSGSFFWIDYFEINAPPSRLSPAYIVSTTTLSPSTGSDPSAFPTELTSHSRSRVSKGAIAGSVIGIIFIMGLLAFLWRRRRRRSTPKFIVPMWDNQAPRNIYHYSSH